MWTISQETEFGYWDLLYQGKYIGRVDDEEDAKQLRDLLNRIELKPRSQR